MRSGRLCTKDSKILVHPSALRVATRGSCEAAARTVSVSTWLGEKGNVDRSRAVGPQGAGDNALSILIHNPEAYSAAVRASAADRQDSPNVDSRAFRYTGLAIRNIKQFHMILITAFNDEPSLTGVTVPNSMSAFFNLEGENNDGKFDLSAFLLERKALGNAVPY